MPLKVFYENKTNNRSTEKHITSYGRSSWQCISVHLDLTKSNKIHMHLCHAQKPLNKKNMV